MSFQSVVRRHLADYKRERLGVPADGEYRRSGKSYPHILPRDQYQLNVLEDIRVDLFAYVASQGITLHRDFHHLNSSQALCFNLFFPFVRDLDADASPLLSAIGLEGARVVRFAFEHIESAEEGTNFDFFATLSDGARVFVEVKYTESEFGSCAADARHDEKLTNIYRSRLESSVMPAALEEPTFFQRYQLLRNVSYANPSAMASVIFLVPRANTSLARAWESFREWLRPEIRCAVRCVYLEDVLDNILSDHGALDEPQRRCVRAFIDKYLPDE